MALEHPGWWAERVSVGGSARVGCARPWHGAWMSVVPPGVPWTNRLVVVLGLVASVVVSACSGGDRVSPHVVASGTTTHGARWVTEASVNRDGQLCLVVRRPREQGDESFGGGGCGWSDETDPTGGPYGVVGGDPQFALGPMPSRGSSVRVSVPGHAPVVIDARPLPAGDGAPAFFVWQLPDAYASSEVDFRLLDSSGRPMNWPL